MGQIKSNIKRCLKNSIAEKLRSLACQESNQNISSLPALISRYLKVNPSLTPQQQLSIHPSIQRDINRLRLGVDSWCYAHQVQTTCSYCNLPFSQEHYLATCPVTSSHKFLQCLSIEEHDLEYTDIVPIMLNRLSREQNGHHLIKALLKYPIDIFCQHPEHGSINYNFIKIPSGL